MASCNNCQHQEFIRKVELASCPLGERRCRSCGMVGMMVCQHAGQKAGAQCPDCGKESI